MTALTQQTMQIINGVAWLSLLVSLTGSMWRLVTNRIRHPFDPLWCLLWFVAAHQLGYIVRWFYDLAWTPAPGADLTSLTGLRVLSIMIAVALTHRRMIIEGWRW